MTRYRLPLLLASLFVLASPNVSAEGLSVPENSLNWPQWQARLSLAGAAPGRLGTIDLADGSGLFRSAPPGAAILGDYYLGGFGLELPRTTGSFRATSGLVFGARNLGLGDLPTLQRGPMRAGTAFTGSSLSMLGWGDTSPAVPYLGLGYTGLALKGGLSFSADIGLTAEVPGGAMRLGRALLGNQGFESALRELRLSPMLQLGVQYSY